MSIAEHCRDGGMTIKETLKILQKSKIMASYNVCKCILENLD